MDKCLLPSLIRSLLRLFILRSAPEQVERRLEDVTSKVALWWFWCPVQIQLQHLVLVLMEPPWVRPPKSPLKFQGTGESVVIDDEFSTLGREVCHLSIDLPNQVGVLLLRINKAFYALEDGQQELSVLLNPCLMKSIVDGYFQQAHGH